MVRLKALETVRKILRSHGYIFHFDFHFLWFFKSIEKQKKIIKRLTYKNTVEKKLKMRYKTNLQDINFGWGYIF